MFGHCQDVVLTGRSIMTETMKTLTQISVVILAGIVFVSCQAPVATVITTGKDSYFSYEFVDVYIDGGERLKEVNFSVVVLKNDMLITTIGAQEEVRMKYIAETNQWEGKWPVPWNPAPGKYTIRLTIPENENHPEVHPVRDGPDGYRDDGRLRRPISNGVKTTSFEIVRREAQEVEPALCVVNWENMRPLRSLRLRCPDGKMGDWTKIFDWLEWLGADALWFIAGQTSAYTKKISTAFPWNQDNLELLNDMAREAEKRGIKSGAWVACYYTFGPKKYHPDYKFGWDYKRSQDTSIETEAISILDEKRLSEIIEFTRKLYQIEELDYVGLDYIPDDYGGVELVDAFVSEMNVEVPDGWTQFSLMERMNWLGKIIKRTKNREIPLIDKWNWWRAHRISSIVKKIKDGAEIKKPLWAFLLSWERGWQHGQDPLMFQDAGVDINAVMLYQANCAQFNALLEHWSSYVGKDDVNIVAGNQVDWFWHQNSLDPPGPQKFYTRLIRGINEMHRDGRVRGLFINDLSRAF